MRSFTTKVKTLAGKVFDLGKFEFPPKNCPGHKDEVTCPKCLIVNAWPEEIQNAKS